MKVSTINTFVKCSDCPDRAVVRIDDMDLCRKDFQRRRSNKALLGSEPKKVMSPRAFNARDILLRRQLEDRIN